MIIFISVRIAQMKFVNLIIADSHTDLNCARPQSKPITSQSQFLMAFLSQKQNLSFSRKSSRKPKSIDASSFPRSRIQNAGYTHLLSEDCRKMHQSRHTASYSLGSGDSYSPDQGRMCASADPHRH